jgi:hypothetical protein
MNARTWYIPNRTDYIIFRRNIRWMPAWLSDQVKGRYWDAIYDRPKKANF